MGTNTKYRAGVWKVLERSLLCARSRGPRRTEPYPGGLSAGVGSATGQPAGGRLRSFTAADYTSTCTHTQLRRAAGLVRKPAIHKPIQTTPALTPPKMSGCGDKLRARWKWPPTMSHLNVCGPGLGSRDVFPALGWYNVGCYSARSA